MSWFSRFAPQPDAPRKGSSSGTARLTGDGSFAVACVGESNYVPALLHAAGTSRSGPGPIEVIVTVEVATEPDNAYDANAVCVLSSAGRKLGYLCREDAADMAPELDRLIRDHGKVWCEARIGGSRVDPSQWRIGIWLDIAF